MNKYRKKPVVIEAIQLHGQEKDVKNILEFMGQKVDLSHPIAGEKFSDYCHIVRKEGIAISTLEGVVTADIGDWVIKGIKGEFYPCKPDIFALTYEKVEG